MQLPSLFSRFIREQGENAEFTHVNEHQRQCSYWLNIKDKMDSFQR